MAIAPVPIFGATIQNHLNMRGFIITTGAKENILQWIDFSAQYNKEIQNIRWIDPIPIFGAHNTKPFENTL